MADLWDKVRVSQGGETIDTFLYRADRAVHDILPELIEATTQDTQDLRQMVDEIAFQPNQFPLQKAELFRRAFNISGLAGSLDYPLMGAVAGSMSGLIERLEGLDERAVTLLKAHADAMLWFLREQVVGDQDKRGLAMLIELRDAAKAYPD
jgi:hypothetical protein